MMLSRLEQICQDLILFPIFHLLLSLICYTDGVGIVSFLQYLDASAFWSLYGLSHHSAFLDTVGVFFAEYAAYVFATVLLIVFFYPSKERAKNKMVVLVSVAAAVIARFGVKAAIVYAYPRPRPFISFTNLQPLISTPLVENFQSFPSGHTIFFFALATVLYCFNKKIGTWALAIAALISIARIYVGVHWPSDILGGVVLGVLTGWAVYRWYRTSRFYV